MSETDEYCRLIPIFPKNAFLLYIFILHQDNILATIPMEPIYKTLKKAAKGVKDLISHFDSIDKTITIPEESLIFPLSFKTLYPLKRDFWKKPEISYNPQTRLKTFNKAFEYPDFFSLLVTPLIFDRNLKNWHFNAALPIISNTKQAMIEKFMFKSDYVVEPKAKYAAIYQIEKKVRFNWKTCKVKEFDNSSKIRMQLAN